jgi:hypothetical protein
MKDDYCISIKLLNYIRSLVNTGESTHVILHVLEKPWKWEEEINQLAQGPKAKGKQKEPKVLIQQPDGVWKNIPKSTFDELNQQGHITQDEKGFYHLGATA